jgi:hypothetical protein
MPKRYEVVERSFINGRLYEAGETVVLEIDSPGSNLKLSGRKAAASATGDDDHKEDGYVAARGAAGKFVVKDAAGATVGIFVGNKAEAEAEAARLNAGGEPLLQDDDHKEDGAGTGNGLPDA